MKSILLRLGIAIWAVVLFLYLKPDSVQAAAQVNTNITVQYGNIGIGTIGANGPAGTYQTIYTAPTSGNNFSKIIGLTATNYDSANAHAVTCRFTNGTTPGLAVWGNVGIGTTAVNLLSSATAPGLPVDQWGNPFRYLPNGGVVQCTYQTAVSSGTNVGIDVQSGEF